jgi:hypothetical protein
MKNKEDQLKNDHDEILNLGKDITYEDFFFDDKIFNSISFSFDKSKNFFLFDYADCNYYLKGYLRYSSFTSSLNKSISFYAVELITVLLFVSSCMISVISLINIVLVIISSFISFRKSKSVTGKVYSFLKNITFLLFFEILILIILSVFKILFDVFKIADIDFIDYIIDLCNSTSISTFLLITIPFLLILTIINIILTVNNEEEKKNEFNKLKEDGKIRFFVSTTSNAELRTPQLQKEFSFNDKKVGIFDDCFFYFIFILFYILFVFYLRGFD